LSMNVSASSPISASRAPSMFITSIPSSTKSPPPLTSLFLRCPSESFPL
jgi:hypothetical protein